MPSRGGQRGHEPANDVAAGSTTGMTEAQKRAVLPKPYKPATSSVPLGEGEYDLFDFCYRKLNSGTRYPVLSGFRNHIQQLLAGAKSPILTRRRWDELFDKYRFAGRGDEQVTLADLQAQPTAAPEPAPAAPAETNTQE